MSSVQPGSEKSVPPEAYKILVAVAFDATGDNALREGIGLASRRGAELHVVHVVPDAALTANEETERSLAKAPVMLRQQIETLWQETGEIQVIGHFRPGSPTDMILRVAAEIEADLLVLGTHHRAGLQKLLLGSIGSYVLQHARCAVLIAMPKDYAANADRIEPACPDCVAVRTQSANRQLWCERHSKPYMQPHVYVPRDEGRDSMMPTY